MSTTDLVAVAYAHDEIEAEMVQGLLLEVGITSLVRRSASADVPELMTGGARDVLVAARDVPFARDVLTVEDPALPVLGTGAETPRAPRSLVALLLAVAVIAGVICIAADLLA